MRKILHTFHFYGSVQFSIWCGQKKNLWHLHGVLHITHLSGGNFLLSFFVTPLSSLFKAFCGRLSRRSSVRILYSIFGYPCYDRLRRDDEIEKGTNSLLSQTRASAFGTCGSNILLI
jgi:hypothetical protein